MQVLGSQAGHRLLELPDRGIGRRRLGRYVNRRRIVEVNREWGRVAGRGREPVQIDVEFADAGHGRSRVCARRGYTVAARIGRSSSDEMIALVGSEDKQSIGLVDALA